MRVQAEVPAKFKDFTWDGTGVASATSNLFMGRFWDIYEMCLDLLDGLFTTFLWDPRG
jgi:hypothetical protein